ncbi:Thioesterase/thiol ester dehydrase-isomerase [Lichtheimia hyalospora FSU 10163]|nr:Thioesterase/thiol ester dehydrase-isomerase [Lichtheimia hyalospora FSU 10163]
MIDKTITYNNDHSSWEFLIYQSLTLKHASPNKLVWEFDVGKQHCNMTGNVHGGCVASLVDECSGFAAFTHKGRNQWKNYGVSVNISASYLRGIPGGETARVEVTTERVGKTLANFYVKIFDANDRLCYTGSHTVFCTDPKI